MSIIKVDYGTVSGGGGNWYENSISANSSDTVNNVTDGVFIFKNNAFTDKHYAVIQNGALVEKLDGTYCTITYNGGTLTITTSTYVVNSAYGYYS